MVLKRGECSSVKKQTSMKSGQNKTKQSSKRKYKRNWICLRRNTQSSQTSQTTTASNTTSGDKATDSSQMVPAELVGTWQVQLKLWKMSKWQWLRTERSLRQTLSPDVNSICTVTTRAKAVASGKIYYWDTDEPGAFEALLPGIAGLGEPMPR